MTKLKIWILLLALVPITGCMTPSKVSAESAAATAAQKRRLTVQGELSDLDKQLATIDGMIAASDARTQSYQTTGPVGKESQITGHEAERRNYEGEKQSLIGRKRKLELALISPSEL